MKQYQQEDWQITSVIHKIVREHVTEGDICIDATAGRGYDTLLLCELTGKQGEVMAFDIQPEALDDTAKRLAEQGYTAELVLDSHANMLDYMGRDCASCIMFNFGYLPGADHRTATQPESSIAAIRAGLEILCRGGIMTLCIYSGGDSGFAEKEAILSFLKGLDSRRYLVITGAYYNRPNHPPIPVVIRKLE